MRSRHDRKRLRLVKFRYSALGVLVCVLLGAGIVVRFVNPTGGVDCGGRRKVVYTNRTTFQQRNMLTCYIHALGRRDRGAMQHIDAPGYRIGPAQLANSFDAASGHAKVYIDRSFDIAHPGVEITFADGRVLELEIEAYNGFWRPDEGSER